MVVGPDASRRPPEEPVVRLFSYGTLRQSAVQMAVFGHALESRPDALPGYELALVKITDPEVIRLSGSDAHPILRRAHDPSSRVEGDALLVTSADVVAADAYEVADYTRVIVRLESGERAYAYLATSDVDGA